jgi:hypothetical protein
MEPWWCTLCGCWIEARQIVSGQHVHLMHPDHDAVPETWPDSGPVIWEEL